MNATVAERLLINSAFLSLLFYIFFNSKIITIFPSQLLPQQYYIHVFTPLRTRAAYAHK